MKIRSRDQACSYIRMLSSREEYDVTICVEDLSCTHCFDEITRMLFDGSENRTKREKTTASFD